MGYQIYGYIQIKEKGEWKTAPVYTNNYKDELKPVILWTGYETGSYLKQHAERVDDIKTKTEFAKEMDYFFEDADEVFTISYSLIKYLAIAFNPKDNDYDDAGEEDYIKPGLEHYVSQIGVIVDFANFYGNEDKIRYIFHESY